MVKTKGWWELQAIFNQFDSDCSGYISLAELQAALEKAGRPVTEEEAQEIIRQVDVDDDNQISPEEFLDIFKIAPEETPTGMEKVYDVSTVYFMTGIRGIGSVGKGIAFDAPKRAVSLLGERLDVQRWGKNPAVGALVAGP